MEKIDLPLLMQKFEQFCVENVDASKKASKKYTDEISKFRLTQRTTEVELRKIALAAATEAHRISSAEYSALATEKKSLIDLFSLTRIRNETYKKKKRDSTEADLMRTMATVDMPHEQERRKEQVRLQNKQANQEEATLQALKKELACLNASLVEIENLKKIAEPAVAAVRSGAWLATDFPEIFQLMLSHAAKNEIAEAKAQAECLSFQTKPSTENFNSWKEEAESQLGIAKSARAGFSISGALPNVVKETVALSEKALTSQALQKLWRYTRPVDRWQMLASLLADPRNLTRDPSWAIHWSAFKAAQSFTDSNSRTLVHEDVLIGKFCADLKIRLEELGLPRLKKLGYPIKTSFIGDCIIASLGEETRVGADIGFIVDINIGGLVCRKVALLQAKKALRGKADIGSEKKQLPKLIATPNLGYYLFFHEGSAEVDPPAPTVSVASELADKVKTRGLDIAAETLRIDPDDTEKWDFAHFLSFGLCQPESPVGIKFTDIDDAFSLLGGGQAGNFPKYLSVIAIADEASVRILMDKIRRKYKEQQKEAEQIQRAATRKSRPEQDRSQGY